MIESFIMNKSVIMLIRLFLSAILGGAIGFEREAHNRPAGFRTHILVTIGSTLIMIVSMNMGPNADPSRIAAQVVSGIGFLGAGTILRTGDNIEGLTTAASLWVCSAIGLAIGSGFYIGGIFVTIIVLFFLEKVSFFERFMNVKSRRNIRIISDIRAGLVGDIGTIFGKYNIVIMRISMQALKAEDKLVEEILFTLKFPKHVAIEELLKNLYDVDGVKEILINDKKS